MNEKIDLQENELNVLSVALMHYYELIAEDQKRLIAEVTRLNVMNTPVLMSKLQFYKQDLDAKTNILDTINGLWGKLFSQNLPQEADE